MQLKKGVRILAIDDSSFSRSDKTALVVGVVGREREVEGILSFRIKVDGNDSTKKIIHKARSSRFANQIKLIAIHGTTLAGLNLVDILEVSRELRVPVVGVLRKKPEKGELENAIRSSKLKDYEKRIELLRRLNKTLKIKKAGSFYLQSVGIDTKSFAKFQTSAVFFLRLAHLVANGISSGESKGRF